MKQSDTSFSTLTKTLETASLIIKPLYYLHFSLEHWTNLHLGDLMKQRNRRPRSPFRSPFVFWRICPTTGSGCQATAAPLSICRIADWQGWFQLGRQSSSHSERPSTSPCQLMSQSVSRAESDSSDLVHLRMSFNRNLVPVSCPNEIESSAQ